MRNYHIIKLTNSKYFMSNLRKQKQIIGKQNIVEFSDLNDNKKNEFLEFLLRNNITFEKNNANDDGYVVKLAVPKQKFNNKENKSEKSINSSHKIDKQTEKSKSKSKSKTGKNSCAIEGKPEFEKSILKITTPKKQVIQTTQSTRKINSKNTQLESSKQALGELKQMNSSSNIKSGRNINKKKPYQICKSVRTTQFQSHQSPYIIKTNKTSEIEYKKNLKVYREDNLNKSVKEKQSGNKQVFILEKEKLILESSKSLSKSPKPSKKTIGSSKEKIVEVNTQIKKKTEEQKQICDLVSKYLKIFDIKLQGQRPIKWPIAQLLKIIQQIYNDLFVKNTQSISHRGHSYREFMGGHQNAFVKFIKEYFMVKQKSQKSANSNIINMLYSLSCYLENEKKISQSKNYVKEYKAGQAMTSTGIFMQNFEDFLCQVFQFEDLLFYLFVRNIVLNQGQLMNSPKIKIEKQLKPHLFQKQVILGYKEIVKILNSVLGQDADLVEEYKIMILTHINSQNSRRTEEHQIKISVPEFISIMIQDYRQKRIIMQQMQVQKLKKNNFANYSLASQNFNDDNGSKKKIHPIEKIEQQANVRVNTNENETDELTFGEQTQSNLQKYLENQISVDQCKQFWENTQETTIFETFPPNSVEVFLCEKLQQKVIEFINILIDNKSEYNSIENKKGQKMSVGQAYQHNNFLTMQKTYIIDLFMKKSVNLLGSLVEMNKLKWFQELKVVDPSQNDIDIVEELQLNYRKLKSNPDAQGIGKLCKSLLTVPQITIALEKLVCF